MPSKQGSVLGRSQNGVCSTKPLKANAYPEIHHFETPIALSDGRPALARSLWNIVWLLYYLPYDLPIPMPQKSGLGQGHSKKRHPYAPLKGCVINKLEA
jgi:hypothetical protein